MNTLHKDRRTRLTKSLIRRAFTDLLAEKSLQRITVREVCQRAGVNRSTFYAHYTDLYDLLTRIEEEMLEDFPVMGCYCDIIGVRSFARFEDREFDYQETILNQFIQYSGRPVFSMEAATRHPLQSFADLITIEEYKKTARPKVVMTWAPHPRPLPQAVPNSFAEWMNATDYDFVITHPKGYELAPQFVGNAKVEYDQMKAFEGADFIYAKNWAAYAGDNYGQILSKDREWTVSDRQMAVTNNAFFMHCLPVRRNMIVTDDVIESPQSIVIPEAANREISATVVLKRLIEGL